MGSPDIRPPEQEKSDRPMTPAAGPCSSPGGACEACRWRALLRPLKGKSDAWQSWRLFLARGILGGYTTFSAFSLDAALPDERGAIGLTALDVIGSVVRSLAGLIAGPALVRSLA